MRQSYLKAGALTFSVLLIALIAINTGIFKNSTASTLIENRWIGQKNSDFNNDKNWSLGHVPTINEKAFFDSLSGSKITIDRKDKLQVGEVELCAGVSLYVKGELIVNRQVLLHSHGSNITVSGSLEVADGFYALNRSNVIVEKGAAIDLQKDLVIENSVFKMNGGVLNTRNVQLRRKGAQLIVEDGVVNVLSNLELFGSTNAQNKLIVNGGELINNGLVCFLKQNENQDINGELIVNDGKMVLNEFSRSPNSFYFHDDYRITLNGGAIEVKNDLVFDTLESDDLIAKYGDNTTHWKSVKVYERAEVDEVVKVVYKEKEYWLSQNKWKSENEEPGVSLNWIYKGKVGEPDETCNCNNVQDWNENTKYIRENKDQEYFVRYKNIIYRMNKESTITKGNEPDNSSWAWTKWFECNDDKEIFRDQFESNGGELILYGNILTRNDLDLANTKLTIGNAAQFSSNNTIEVDELYLSRDALLLLNHDLIVNKDLYNHSDKGVMGKASLVFSGSAFSSIKGTKALLVNHLLVDKDSADITSYIDLEIGESLTWKTASPIHLVGASVSKNKTSQPTTVTFSLGASHSGNGWVNGAVRAVTNNEFVFPTGNEAFSAKIELSYPGETSIYKVEYINGYPPYYNELEGTLKNISKLEYWSIKTEKGNSKVVATAHWQNSNWSNINMPKDLVLVGLQSDKWISLGNRFCNEKEGAGNITAQKYLNDIELVTFGSVGGLNGLNNENSPFASENSNKGIEIDIDLNNDLIIDVTLIKENTNNKAQRVALDFNSTTNAWDVPNSETVDKGDIIEVITKNNKVFRSSIDQNEQNSFSVEVFPNPFVDEFIVKLNEPTSTEIRLELLGVDGKTIFTKEQRPDASGNLSVSGLQDLKPGNYILKVYSSETITTITLIKQ
jgi:hypothetical protein